MFKLLDYISEASNAQNEDFLWYQDNIIVLFDGSSQLYDLVLRTQEFIQLFIRFFKAELNCTKDLLGSIEGALKHIRLKLRKDNPEIDFNHNLPSAAAVFVYQTPDNVQIFTLGDCTALLLLDNNELLEIYDDRVEQLDNQVLSRALEIQQKTKENISSIVKRSEIKRMLVTNRLKMNQKNGYDVLALNLTNLKKDYLFEFPNHSIQKIALYTDGFKLLKKDIETFNFETQSLYSKLRYIEKSDSEFNIYPRLKMGDDATLALFQVIYE